MRYALPVPLDMSTVLPSVPLGMAVNNPISYTCPAVKVTVEGIVIVVAPLVFVTAVALVLVVHLQHDIICSPLSEKRREAKPKYGKELHFPLLGQHFLWKWNHSNPEQSFKTI